MSAIDKANQLMESYAKSLTGYMSTLDAAEVIEDLLDELQKRDKVILIYETRMEAAAIAIFNAYEHIQHEDYNDALSSTNEAYAALTKKE